ncbi:lysosomal-trafficking regulator [Protopterus annectens]|uniref:lysosomal-trafficking regulator n=1 Tax=Protopterus annectens TaxID=7888 RepID=UPI001CFB6581|nr:lysosomal-trafficking regulator [Protopterus annectens]
MSSLSNTLAREFLKDVHRLCNAMAQRAEAREEEEEESHVAVLGEYLVQGRGFLLLSTLDSIIDQELTCREELLTLLLSLLPLVWKIRVQAEKAADFKLPALKDVFLPKDIKLFTPKSTQENPDLEEISFSSSRSFSKRTFCSWNGRHPQKSCQRYSVRNAKKAHLSTSDSDANSEERARMIRHRRSRVLQPFINYQSRVDSLPGRSSHPSADAVKDSHLDTTSLENKSHCPSVYLLCSHMLTDPAAASLVSKMENTSFDLCHVLLSLLEKVCKFDMALNQNPALTASVVPTLTEFLSVFGDCCNESDSVESEEVAFGWKEEPIALVQRMLLRAVLHLMFVDINNRSAIPETLRKNFTDLLRATLKIRNCLEKQADPFAPRPKKTLQEVQEEFSFSRYRQRAFLLPELLEGVLQVLISCLQTAASNPFFFSQAMDLIHEFIQHNGFEVFESTVLQMEWLVTRGEQASIEASEHVKTLISSVMKIISTVKKIKSEQLHQSVCTRKRHRRCEYSHLMHHHRDLSGLPVSAFKNPALKNPFEETVDGDLHYPERCCCVAVCAHQCLRLLQFVSLNNTCTEILSGIHTVGICCCMDPRSVIAPLLHAFRLPAFKNFQQNILSALHKLILDQLGGGDISEKMKLAACNICTFDSNQLPDLEEALQRSSVDGQGSSVSTYRSEGILPTGGSDDMLWKWDALEAYQDLVFSDDGQQSLLIACHICQLIQKGTAAVQWQLYIHVFNPVLQRGVEMAHHAQHLGVSVACSNVCSYHSRCLSPDVLLVYLQTLPTLFRFRLVREMFLNCNGLSQVTELTYLDSIRSYALKLFETLILCLEEQQNDSLIQEQEKMQLEHKDFKLCADESNDRYTPVTKLEPPQSLSKFYAGLKEVCPKKKKSISSDIHINVINLFLCVAFLCVSKEADSDRDSANDSEDTSGYDSTASEPLGHMPPCLSKESVILPSVEQIKRVVDIWSMCRSIFLSSKAFQKQFYQLGGFEVCYRLMMMIIQKLSEWKHTHKQEEDKSVCAEEALSGGFPDAVDKQSSLISDQNLMKLDTDLSSQSPLKVAEINYQLELFEEKLFLNSSDLEEERTHKKLEEEWPYQSIRLLEALLVICLNSTVGPQKTEMDISYQILSVDEILSEMHKQLSQSGIVDSIIAKPLFDSLLRVAVAGCCEDFESSDENLKKTPKSEGAESLSQQGDTSEEAEESKCYSSKLFADEEDYDADSESNPKEMAAKEEGASVKQDETLLHSGPDENIMKGELIYPEICSLLLHLLSTGSPSLAVVTHYFKSLMRIVKHSEKNANLIIQQGSVNIILGGFQNVLSQSSSSLEECQEVLVELLVALIRSRTSSEELVLLLRIFLEETPPMEILLKGILNIAEANRDIAPLQHLSFPLVLSISSGTLPSVQKLGTVASSRTSSILKRARLPPIMKEMDSDGTTNHHLSSWHVAPIQLPLLGQNCWPHMSEGFSVSLWLKVEWPLESEGFAEKGKKPRRKRLLVCRDSSIDSIEGAVVIDYFGDGTSGDRPLEDGCVHIISLGSKAIMLQVWSDLSTGTLIFRICIDPNDDSKLSLLAQAESQEQVLTPGKWQHVAMTYVQKAEGKKNVHGKLTLWVSGQRKSEVALDYIHPRKSGLSSDSNKTFCMIGHCCNTPGDSLRLSGKWDAGNLLLFNGSRIGPEEAFYLYVCGPDYTSVMPCKYGKPKPNYSKYIDKAILSHETIKELIMKNKEIDLGPLVENLAVVYSPSSVGFYTIYEPVVRLKSQIKTVPSQRPFSVKEVQSNILDPSQLKTLQPVKREDLQSSLHEIGGTKAFIFLFARTVEVSSCEKTQALALQIVLSLTKYNQQRVQEMESCHGYSLIHQVLIKPKCIVGFHMLKTLLDGCCSDSVFNISEDGQFQLKIDSQAVIQDLDLLEELLLDWKIWGHALPGVWETLLSALEILIRVGHPQQMFNTKQLLKAKVLHRFLLTCQVLQEQKDEYLKSLPNEVCKSFVKIIQEVLGSPPDLELLRLIYNFLLAVHPPTNTYVCHSPSSFYFSLHIDGKIFQEKVQSIIYLRHSSSGGKSSESPGFLVTPLSGFTAIQLDGKGFVLHSSQRKTSSSPLYRQCSKSLPTSPSCSPKVRIRHLTEGLNSSFGDLREEMSSRVNSISLHQKHLSNLGSADTLKRVNDDLCISSCESAKTVCESPFLSDTQSCEDLPAEKLNVKVCDLVSKQADVTLQNTENIRSEKVASNTFVVEGGDAADELVQRPDSLKGIYSFQRSQSSGATLGLAFPTPTGSMTFSRWPSTVDRSSLTVDWDSFPPSPAYEKAFGKAESDSDRSTEDCLVLICCGLYELLRGILLLLPDVMLGEVLDKLIQPDALIVLVNHPSPLIQQGVIKLLDAYFNRASKEQKDKFLKMKGFSLLANQLYLHQGTQGLLECFLDMLFGRPVGLDDDLILDDIPGISLFRKSCIIPVLGLIENSLYESALVHNTLCVLLQILDAGPKVTDILLDSGLLFVLLNTLAALNEMEADVPAKDYKLLVCDIQQLLIAIAIHSCSSSGTRYFQIIEDMITLLGYLQKCKTRKTQDMAVCLQFKVLQSAIEFIKTTASQDSHSLTSSVQLLSPQHDAFYQKRKSIAGARRFSLAQSDTLVMKMRSVANDELALMMQRRMSQENPLRAMETEFVQRLQRLTVLAINRLIHQVPTKDCIDHLTILESPVQSTSSLSQLELEGKDESSSEPHSCMKVFQKELFTMMVEGLKICLGTGRSSTPRQQWKRVLWSCKDTFRLQLSRLLVYMLSPARLMEERKEPLELVCEPNYQEILKDCLSSGTLEHGPKLALYLYELLKDHKEELSVDEHEKAETLMTTLKLSGYRCIPLSAPPKQDLIKASSEELKKCETEENTNRTAWQKKMETAQQSLLQRLDTKSKEISKIAGDITQKISLQQNMERKKVMQHIRTLYKLNLSASRYWQELVHQFGHDRALWYDPASYPSSWQLDPTEGPNRERRRLQRCFMTIPNKYLLKERRKPEEPCTPPLSFLFEDKAHSSFSSAVKDKATSEAIRFNRRCISVAPSRETSGELLLGRSGMYFVEDNAVESCESYNIHGELEPASFSWTYEEIKEVHKRWWQLRDNAVEIFLTNGRTLLLAFDNAKVRDNVYQNILSCSLPNLLEYGNITALTHLWCTGQMTNFEYLTHLNKHAGRSFNDLMQYPVFPFILADYTNETLDLTDPVIYRNLSKPIAVQSKEKEDRYVDNYKYLEEEYRKGARDDDPMPPVQPYHYGSHYSNSGTVLHFLVRLPPFTKMFLAYQDQSFDIPDRTFHSMNTTWRLSSYESMTDVKELIPEFFYLPEFLVNREGFDFGVRQNSERVNNVNLPSWARNDPRLFILIHRQALESDYVSQTISHWIDLVFGNKQKGKAAVQAINVFHPATYFGMDVSAVEDPVQRRALETMIKTYGQTPRQLFTTAHVSRPGSKLIIEGELPAAMGLLVQFAFREPRGEHAKEITYPSPLPWIKGLKWGEYVGSPSTTDPVVCFSQPHGERFGSLQALPTKAICGLSRKFCLMMIYSKEQGVRSMHNTDIQWSAILSWGYSDNMLRLKSKQSEPPVNFIQYSQLHQVTSCAWVPDSCQLFTGSKCGVLTAYSNRFTNSTPTEIEVIGEVQLYGHTAEVTSLIVCKPYSTLISASNDGTCIIWDLNRLCYVQSLTGHKSPVIAVSASETTGDIATVCDSVAGGSDLRLWTVNGYLIGHVHCREIICSVAFSNQPEGISVNVIAGGLENGVVRLWSTWDLKPVREITFPKSNKPIISLTFSCDGHHLYTANSEGTVIAWCRKDQQRLKLPMFFSFLSSYAAG